MVKRWGIWGIASLLFLFFNPMASAFAVENAGPSQAALKKDFEQSFAQMMADPGDVDLAIHYSSTAEALGNYEAAIPPLERLLMFNPDLPDIKLKLGILYHKLGSNDVARTYFEGAMKGKNVSQHVISEAKSYLKKI